MSTTCADHWPCCPCPHVRHDGGIKTQCPGTNDPTMVAQFNGGMVDGAKLAEVLREYPTATLQVNDGWIDVYSADLPRSHPLNVISDVIQAAWEQGAITDARYNEVCSCLETLWRDE